MHIYYTLCRSKNTCRGMPALERKMIRLWHKLLSCVTAFGCAFVSGAQILVRLCPVKATPSEARKRNRKHPKPSSHISPQIITPVTSNLESKHLTEGRDIKLSWWVGKAQVILFYSQNLNKIKTSIGKSWTSTAVKLCSYFQFWETWGNVVDILFEVIVDASS